MQIKKFKDYINKKVDEVDAYFYPKTYRVKNFIENQSVSDIREVLYNFTDEFTTSHIFYYMYADHQYLGLNADEKTDRFYSLTNGDINYILNNVRKVTDQNKKISFKISLHLNDPRFKGTQSMENYELEECLIECGEQIKDMCHFDTFDYSRQRDSYGEATCTMIFTF